MTKIDNPEELEAYMNSEDAMALVEFILRAAEGLVMGQFQNDAAVALGVAVPSGKKFAVSLKEVKP